MMKGALEQLLADAGEAAQLRESFALQAQGPVSVASLRLRWLPCVKIHAFFGHTPADGSAQTMGLSLISGLLGVHAFLYSGIALLVCLA